ncbi:MAG: DUF6788 family protein [Terriglobia bacterium]
MAETIPQLEDQRTQVVQEIAGLGDFRRGSITSLIGRCGKTNCCCRQPGHPGHGPNFRLTRFQALSRALVGTNEKICRLRPVEVEKESSTQEKKRPKRSGNRSRTK